MELWKHPIENLLNLIFPPRCPMCGELLCHGEHICSRCINETEFICHPICRQCGRPWGRCRCGTESSPFFFTRNISPLIYSKAARSGIHRMKFHNSPSSCTYFGKLMALAVRTEYLDAGIPIDCVMGVPMYCDDERRRGYNQANLLAKIVASELNLPCFSRVLTKYRKNENQHTLSYAERQKNIRNVFRVAHPKKITDKTVLLCDDVITSGSTLNECARILLEAGAGAVYCVTATTAVQS
ncbi:MAG: ComF family protein [Clostridia bacterium]|nr:ComF family protein [Clostridia bacterium]